MMTWEHIQTEDWNACSPAAINPHIQTHPSEFDNDLSETPNIAMVSVLTSQPVHRAWHVAWFACHLVLACLCGMPATAQWIDDPALERTIRQGVDATYGLRFNEADAAFKQVMQQRPAHPAGYFFEAMVDWWRILIAFEDDSRDQAFLDKLDRVIDMCDALLDRNEDDLTALFFKGGALGFRGRLHAARKSWVRAAGDGKDALPVVLNASRIARSNPDLDLGVGIYDYYAAVLPERYPVLKPLMLFLPSGDKKKGLRELSNAAERGRYANWEAIHMLVQAYGTFENQPAAALPYARRLCRAFPENPVFQRDFAKLCAALGDWPKAADAYGDILGKCQRNQTGYTRHAQREARYYLGYAAMLRLDFDIAMRHLEACDELSRALDTDGVSGFMVMANLRMGMIYDAQNRRDLARKQYNKVLRMDDIRGSHDLALKYLNTPYSTK
jgi:tetratricopeptide (TPR) repeat protein